MRPKASEENLRKALAIAEIVTTVSLNNEILKFVERRGPASIFRLISKCFPAIVRDNTKTAEQNRHTFSEIELNKYLAKHGFVSTRYRNRIKGTVDKWEKGTLRWSNRRWRPLDSSDLLYMRDGLAFLQCTYKGLVTNIDFTFAKMMEFWNVVLSEQASVSLNPVQKTQMMAQSRICFFEHTFFYPPEFKLLPPGFELFVAPYYQVLQRLFVTHRHSRIQPKRHTLAADWRTGWRSRCALQVHARRPATRDRRGNWCRRRFPRTSGTGLPDALLPRHLRDGTGGAPVLRTRRFRRDHL